MRSSCDLDITRLRRRRDALGQDEMSQLMAAEAFERAAVAVNTTNNYTSLKCTLNSSHGSDFVLSSLFSPEDFKASYVNNSELLQCAVCLKCVDEPVRWGTALEATKHLPVDQALAMLIARDFTVAREELEIHRNHQNTGGDVSPAKRHLQMLNNIIRMHYEKFVTLQQFQYVQIVKGGEVTHVPNAAVHDITMSQSKSFCGALKLYNEMSKNDRALTGGD